MKNNCLPLDIQPLREFKSNELILGLKLERLYEKTFRCWGVFVAKHPWPVIISSLIISLILTIGVYTKYQVTTDPIDLWVSSESQARHDMEYFNQHFWKFYRIEQIILEPKNSNYFQREITENDEKKNVTFGPAFNYEFLKEAFKLQLKIQNLTALNSNGKLISLNDICFKPLGEDCATQSIFTFFLDKLENLNPEAYLQKISDCTR